MINRDLYQAYIPAVKTNVLETFKKHGWEPPSDQQCMQEKWATYRNLAAINEEIANEPNNY